eukprot:SAG31_NODE_4531_length_3158_cov_4.651193_3_plen_78_part_00
MAQDQIRTKGGINLVGAAVGNGVGGGPTARGDRIRTKFYYNKGMISQKLGEAIISEVRCPFLLIWRHALVQGGILPQ